MEQKNSNDKLRDILTKIKGIKNVKIIICILAVAVALLIYGSVVPGKSGSTAEKVTTDEIKNITYSDNEEKLADIMGVRALLDKKIFELSGGEKQRAAICRALINHSDLILADEPTGNLDSASSETVMEYLQMINKDLKKAVVLVTHDAYVASFCDRVIFVKDGNIEVELRKKEKQDVFCDKIMKAQKDILKNK